MFMKIDSASIANWLVSTAVVIGLLVVGQPLLVPFLFAVLLWTVFNALSDRLMSVKFPRWLAWFSSLLLVAAALYVIALILSNEATAVANLGPGYISKFEALSTKWFAFLRLGPAFSLTDLIGRFDLPGMLGRTATSVGGIFFQLILIATFVGFLLSEQHHLPAKLARLTTDARRDQGKEVIRTIARQIQTYLGVCTLLSATMAGATYGVLTLIGVDFAGFWALVMFLLTYIPVIGAIGVLLPSLMALLQFGSLADFFLVGIILGVVHFVLTNVAQAILLGRSLNLSPLVIILSLTFWGLIWGVAGLFLAVPIMAAIAIICAHVDGLRWVTIALADTPNGDPRAPALPGD
jgi:AI-2 transport protein TqsA